MDEEKPVQVSIRFTPDMYRKIEQLAKTQERSFNGQAVWMIKERLWQIETDARRHRGLSISDIMSDMTKE